MAERRHGCGGLGWAAAGKEPMFLKTFGASFAVAAAGLVLGLIYGGGTGLALVAILAVLEISLSFDNAVVNATVLVRLQPFLAEALPRPSASPSRWWGCGWCSRCWLSATRRNSAPHTPSGSRCTAGNAKVPGTYGYLLNQAHPAIAASGGVFLLMLFLDFVFAGP